MLVEDGEEWTEVEGTVVAVGPVVGGLRALIVVMKLWEALEVGGEAVPPLMDVGDEHEDGAAADGAHEDGFVEELQGASGESAGLHIAGERELSSILLLILSGVRGWILRSMMKRAMGARGRADGRIACAVTVVR